MELLFLLKGRQKSGLKKSCCLCPTLPNTEPVDWLSLMLVYCRPWHCNFWSSQSVTTWWTYKLFNWEWPWHHIRILKLCGNRSLKDVQLLFQYFFLHCTLTWQLMQKFCFVINLVLITNEPVEIHIWNLGQVYDEHVYRPDHKMIPVGASMWHDAWEFCYLQ